MAVGDRNNGLLHAVRHCFAVLAVRNLGSSHDSSMLLGASLVDGGYLDLAWLYFLRHPVADSRLDGSLRLVVGRPHVHCRVANCQAVEFLRLRLRLHLRLRLRLDSHQGDFPVLGF